jgi:hypothetical protein
MKAHGLSPAAVGQILGRSAQTVRVWRCKWDGRVIPDMALALLEKSITTLATDEVASA